MLKTPKIGVSLNKNQLELLKAVSTSARHSIIDMLKNSQSGHPGGSLSSIDYLTILYSFVISQTGEKIVISNGHISPAVYAILAEMGYVDKKQVIQGFRKPNSLFEGHVSRKVPGIWYGTGPLGTGISAASGFALGEKLKKSQEKVFGLLGDGEMEEGQVYEMMNFAAKYKLNNLIIFLDYNKVQLSGSLEKIMPINPKKIFLAAGWQVIETNGHDFTKMWQTLSLAYKVKDKPVVILGKTIMGKGVDFMEKIGKEFKSDWHGKAPNQEEAEKALAKLTLNQEQKNLLAEFKKLIKWKPKKPVFLKPFSPTKIKTGQPIIYSPEKLTDCRTAYGQALLSLAKLNQNIVALSADLADSVMTKFVRDEKPEQHVEVGIAEQHMVSCSGGLSLNGFIPFCSTFAAFMTSRAKDQARVNDINETNVKMVATHAGLSVGEDGPTHQAIDDLSSFLGLFNTMIIEPADPNQCDRIIRYTASNYGNFYVRMGRHKIPVLTTEEGKIFFDENYEYEYGRCDILRPGTGLTIVTIGATASEALKAYNILKLSHPQISIELVIASSIKKFDSNLLNSLQKTGRLLTVEDHNTTSGLGNQIARFMVDNNLNLKKVAHLGVTEYQLSGSAPDLYKVAGISGEQIANKILELLK